MKISDEINKLIVEMGDLFLQSPVANDFDDFLRFIIKKPYNSEKLEDWLTVLEIPELQNAANQLSVLIHCPKETLVEELQYRKTVVDSLYTSLSEWHERHPSRKVTNSYLFRDTKARLYTARLFRLAKKFQAATADKERDKINLEFKMVLTERKITSVNLVGINLTGMNISSCDFSHCEMQRAILDKVKGKKAKFDNANLFSCHMQGAQLNLCSFVQTDFRGKDRKNRSYFADTIFKSCIFSGADFAKADLRGASFEVIDPNSLRDVKLAEAWLDKNLLLYLSPWSDKTGGFNLFSFKSISLDGEDLSNLNLSNLYLTRVYFGKATVTNTIFNNTDLQNACLKHVKGLQIKQLTGAIHVAEAELSTKIAEQVSALRGQRTLQHFFPLGKRKLSDDRKDETVVDWRQKSPL